MYDLSNEVEAMFNPCVSLEAAAAISQGLSVELVPMTSDTDETDDHPLVIYSEDGKPLKEDSALLNASKYLAAIWAEDVAKSMAEYKPDFQESKSRIVLRDLAMKRAKGGMYTKADLVQAKEAMKRLNYGRTMNGLEAYTKDDFHVIFDAYLEEANAELEAETCATYIEDGLDLDEAEGISYADPSTEDLNDDQIEVIATHVSPVDVKWSNLARAAIEAKMDPHGLGYATQPMKFQGDYCDGRTGRIYPLGHKTLEQSLAWLSRTIGDPRFTAEDRAILIEFRAYSYGVLRRNFAR